MSAAVQLAAVLLALIVSASAHVTAIVLGEPVTVPVLWLIAAAVVLWLLRAIVHDGGLFLRPRTVEA